MLRVALFVISGVLLVAGLAASCAGWPAIPPSAVGGILLLALLFERYVYKPIRTEPPGPGWEQTAERFIDPKSGQNVTVYFNPRTGERRYVGGAKT